MDGMAEAFSGPRTGIDEILPEDDDRIVLHKARAYWRRRHCGGNRRRPHGLATSSLELTGAGRMTGLGSPVARGIIWREGLRFVQQKGRFLSALVRPLVWLFIFAAGFRAVLGIPIQPPYQTYLLYDEYVVPGLCAMILLFNGMQSSSEHGL